VTSFVGILLLGLRQHQLLPSAGLNLRTKAF
jgi:hypothetical protein